MTAPTSKRTNKGQHSSSVAKKAARNAMLKVAGTTKASQTQLERVVQSVNDATKRLSQPESILSTSTATKSSKRKSRDTVGPWKLGKTLGKGSSGRVRLAKNMETGQLAAIKIVPRKNNLHTKNEETSRGSSVSYMSSSSNATSTIQNTTANANTNATGNVNNISNPYGIEREIVIMKLISHSNVLGLYEVWENKSELYLVLEYVDGGELFDYLVSKGKLCEREAVHYFKQIVQGVSYCHSFNICHRDLKPENLLLDKKNRTIKIADFGMAALEISNKLLETSCGSPHYASPEIVMGKPYHGGPSDVWSCGIILFALLTGHLPFNDDSIKKLLLKVQSGRYQMPMSLSKEARDLVSKILVVNPARRITTEDILSHPLITKYEKPPFKTKNYKATNFNMRQGKSNADLHLLNEYDRSTVHLKSRNDIDDTILSNLQILWHGASRELIVAKLLQPSMCEEKVFYSLLLRYKEKHRDRALAESEAIQKKSAPNKTEVVEEIVENKKIEDSNAPRLLQKSQFSVASLKREASSYSVSALPSSALPPTLPAFAVSSSRTFKKSGSLLSMQSQKSLKPSVVKSSSKKSLSRTGSKRTLQNSSSKRSLYSLTSISKKSLNLSDYVANENSYFEANQLPPLPSADSNNDFEDLCNQILYGNALDKILEEEEEEDNGKQEDESDARDDTSYVTDKTYTKSLNSQNNPAGIPLAEDLKPAFVLGEHVSENTVSSKAPTTVNTISRSPLKDVTNNSPTRNRSISQLKRDTSQKSNLSNILATPKQSSGYHTANNRNFTAYSVTLPKEQHFSLDPRRSASQPQNTKVVESLLHKIKGKSNLKNNRKSNDWSYARGSIFGGNSSNAGENSIGPKYEIDAPGSSSLYSKRGLETLSDFDNTDIDVLAHSSTVQAAPLISLPSVGLNPTMSFKNLNEYLEDPGESYVTSSRKPSASGKSAPMRKYSKNVTLAPKGSFITPLERKGMHSKTNSSVSNDFDQISDMSYALDIPTNTFMAQAVTISNHDSAERITTEHVSRRSQENNEMKNNENYTPATIYDDTRVNIFEDAPTDAESFDATSSEGDSIPNVHRKAVSIETLNNTNVLAPSTNVRVSLYVNNNMNSNTILPRETTEEIISKFQMPAEKSPTHVSKRASPTNTSSKADGHTKRSQSVISMFKDVEDDENEDVISQTNFQSPSNVAAQEKTQEPQPTRVTMLFDADEEEHHKLKEKNTRLENQVPTSKENAKPEVNSVKKADKKKEIHPKVKPLPTQRAADSTYHASTPKKSWFKKLFGGFTTGGGDLRFAQTHNTSLPFDDAHMLTLNEFDKNAVDYYLRSSGRKDRKETVEYDCKFVKGNFKFRIKIVNDGTLITNKPTSITLKKKSGKNTLDSEQAFQVFNADVARVIRQLELKNKST